MDPESDPKDPGRLYAKNLKDKIVRDATTSWTGSPDPADAGFRLTPRLVVGLAIMIAGFLLALDSLGWADAGEVFRYWPLALVAVGCAAATEGTATLNGGRPTSATRTSSGAAIA